MRFKAAWAGALLAGAVMAAPAHAQITVAGTTAGCFGASCTPGAGTTATVGNLVFNFGSFLTTNGNVGGIGNNFGTLTLGQGAFDYDNTPFTLFFSFTQPGLSTGSPAFEAALSGNVVLTTDGVNLVFSNPLTQSATLNDGSTVTVTVPNLVAVNANNPAAQITGIVTVSPEPASMTLLATGLVGIFGAARRRRKKLAA